MSKLHKLLLAAAVAGALPLGAQADIILSSNDGHSVMDAQKSHRGACATRPRYRDRHRRQILPAQDQGHIRGTRQRRRSAWRDLDQQG